MAWGGGSNAASGKSDKQQIIDLEHGLIAATNQKNVDEMMSYYDGTDRLITHRRIGLCARGDDHPFSAMSIVQAIIKDLRERRLWPVAIALVAALVAVPVLLMHSAKSVPVPPAAAAGLPTSLASGGPVVSAGSVAHSGDPSAPHKRCQWSSVATAMAIQQSRRPNSSISAVR